MKIGIGLPNAVHGASGRNVVEFARTAEERGFSTLGTIDRIVYDNHDPLVTLGAAAAATERIGLATTILVGPPRGNGAVIAKQAATVQSLSGGRFWLGIGLGGREDDFEAGGVPFEGRGKRFDRLLAEIEQVWAGEERGTAGAIGPAAETPPIIVGGSVEASFERVAKHGVGWIMGGGDPDQFAEAAKGVRAAWHDAGRDGEPELKALAYFSLGPDAEANATEKIGGYYAWLGETTRDMIAGSAATSDEMVRQYIAGFEGAGCGELILFPASDDPAQVDLLADAAGI